MTIKIKNTETYEEHIVCKSKLVLIKATITEDRILLVDNIYFKPLIISEIEKIEKGDYGYCWNWWDKINYFNNGINEGKQGDGIKKILALPEQFSPQQLQDIIDGKLKDGDKVFIKCGTFDDHYSYHIDLTNGFIKLFPIKKEESWDDTWNEYLKENPAFDNERISFIEYLKKNYNLPIKKR